MAHLFHTSYDIQEVPLHEVRNVVGGVFLSQFLTSLGASLFSSCYAITLTIGSASLALNSTRTGVTLIVVGSIVYALFVVGAYQSWRRRRIPSTVQRAETQTRTDSDGGSASIYV
jgi:hypothetical protein